MGAERSGIAAWVASWDDRERASALAGLEEKRGALREMLGADPGADAGADERDVLAAAVFLEYAERIGVCPLELHWLVEDAAAASMEAVLTVRVQMMIEDAARRRAGRDRAETPRATGPGRPCPDLDTRATNGGAGRIAPGRAGRARSPRG